MWAFVRLAIAAVVIFTASQIVGRSPEAKERIREMMAIDDCKENQKRPSLDRATARVIITCEMLEARYETKHGRKP